MCVRCQFRFCDKLSYGHFEFAVTQNALSYGFEVENEGKQEKPL
jgi:hypothetical protein